MVGKDDQRTRVQTNFFFFSLFMFPVEGPSRSLSTVVLSSLGLMEIDCEAPLAHAKITQHDIGQAVNTGVTMRQHQSVTSHSLSFSAETAILGAADIGLLTTEQTRVHLSHVHGGVHVQLVRHQPVQPFGQARLEIAQ